MNPQFNQPKGSTVFFLNKKTVARAANVTEDSVIFGSDKSSALDSKTIIYDESSQKIWGKPNGIPNGAKIVSIAGSNLTYSPNNTVVPLVYIPGSGSELKSLLSADSGGSLVNTKINLAGAVARSIEQMFRDFVSVVSFGADPTGVSPSGTKIQQAMDAVSGKLAGSVRGGRLYAPAGKYTIEVPLTYSWRSTAGLSDADIRRLCIEGDGSGSTFFNYTGDNTQPCLTVDAGDVSTQDPHLRLTIEGIRFQRKDNSRVGIGLHLKNIAIMRLIDCDVHWFGTGVAFHDVIQVQVQHCQMGANVVGMTMSKLSWTQPNVFQLHHVMFGGNSQYAVIIDNGANVKFDTCSFEGTGNDNSQATGLSTILYRGTPHEGGVGLTVKNSYFENNNVYSDITIANGEPLPGVHLIEGNSFQRTSPTSYCKNHVYLTAANSAYPIQVHLKANRFKFAGGYTHNAGDKSVFVETQWVNVNDDGNMYEPEQPPSYNGMTVRGYRDAVAVAVRVDNAGAIVAEHNVGSITKGAVGTYTVNYRKSLADDLVIPTASIMGVPGRVVITSSTKDSTTVVVQDSGGNAADGIGFSLHVVGVYKGY